MGRFCGSLWGGDCLVTGGGGGILSWVWWVVMMYWWWEFRMGSLTWVLFCSPREWNCGYRRQSWDERFAFPEPSF